MSAIRRMDGNFPTLFDTDVQGNNEPDNGGGEDNVTIFMRSFGWIYNTESVADFERIKIEEAYELPTLQYLNDLAYLKARADMESEQLKKYAGNTSRGAT